MSFTKTANNIFKLFQVIFSTTDITGHGPEGVVTLDYSSDDVYTFGDIEITVHNRAHFRHSGATFTVDDSVFELSIKGWVS